MSWRQSITARIALALGLLFTLLWLVTAAVSLLVIRQELDEAFDSALQEMAERMMSLAVAEVLHRGEDAEAKRMPLVGLRGEFLTYVLRDASGRLLLASHDADPATFPARPAAGFHATEQHRLYGVSALDGRIFIEVADPLAHRREATWEAARLLFVPLAIVTPASFLLIWLILRRMLRPVARLRDTIDARAPRDLEPLSERGLPTELEPLVLAFNRLLDRVRTARAAEQSFTANSAHELRTPVAGALAHTQRLIAETSDAAIRSRAQAIETALRRLANISEKLMQLAKAEGTALVTEAPADLVPILGMVIGDLAERQRPDRITVRGPAGLGLRSSLDPDMFAIILRNLVENALVHGAAESPVEIAVEPAGVIRVTNAGRVIPPAMLPLLSRRFERNGATAPGSGLGLAIVDAALRGAGGRLELASPAPGRTDGFEAKVVLPEAIAA